MQCVIAGAGYVGLTTALVLVERGHAVTVVDIDEVRAQRIANGEVPFVEPGVDAALRSALKTGRLATGTDLSSAVASAEAVFLCVGTPSLPNGDADLSYVKEASRQIGEGLRRNERPLLVITKSTVPPGTTVGLVGPSVAKASRKKEGEGFHVVSNPEFLREGLALQDARKPDRIVVGATSPQARDRAALVWEIPGVPVVKTDPTTAELIKYASNAFLAVKISFANELARLCQEVGVDVYDVAHGMGLDARIGPQFLRAGAGFGGSCFPKDVKALDKFAKKQGVRLRLPRAVLDINEEQPLAVVDLLEKHLGGLAGKRVALLGLAFKPDTDDVRETRALPMFQELQKRGAEVACWDPVAGDNFQKLVGRAAYVTPNLKEALKGRDAALIQTEWRHLRELRPGEWRILLKGDLIVDGRRSLDPEAMRAEGFRYVMVGAPPRGPGV